MRTSKFRFIKTLKKNQSRKKISDSFWTSHWTSPIFYLNSNIILSFALNLQKQQQFTQYQRKLQHGLEVEDRYEAGEDLEERKEEKEEY